MFSEGDLNAGWQTGVGDSASSAGGGWSSVLSSLGSVATSLLSKKNESGSTGQQTSSQDFDFYGGVKDINFSGSLNSQLPYFLIGVAAVMILGWLKKSKRKK
ncbi:MAG: hypothetical protein K8R45_11985 [Desulfobacterales bacterium]|nr:hypothetical protein [Desulfobacterales bacterium]